MKTIANRLHELEEEVSTLKGQLADLFRIVENIQYDIEHPHNCQCTSCT